MWQQIHQLARSCYLVADAVVAMNGFPATAHNALASVHDARVPTGTNLAVFGWVKADD